MLARCCAQTLIASEPAAGTSSPPAMSAPLLETLARAVAVGASARSVEWDTPIGAVSGRTAGIDDDGALRVSVDGGRRAHNLGDASLDRDMLLAIDVGNTNIVLGVFEGELLTESWRLVTMRERTSDEIGILVTHLFERSDIDLARIDGIILSSVVPPLTRHDGGDVRAVLRKRR